MKTVGHSALEIQLGDGSFTQIFFQIKNGNKASIDHSILDHSQQICLSLVILSRACAIVVPILRYDKRFAGEISSAKPVRINLSVVFTDGKFFFLSILNT